MSYRAPVKDMLFNLEVVGALAQTATWPGFEDAGLDTAQAVLEECARFNEDVLAPLNRQGDLHPATWHDGDVTSSPGFAAAFRQFAQGGWQGLQHPVVHGGQGLPKVIEAACSEMLNSANVSFALCPMLTDGAIEALLLAGTESQCQTYIPRFIAGDWTGTMNLTEPQAGSDLALVRTRAEPQPDGSYRMFGTKIFITFGEHDMAENIVHMVLARVVGAPEGVKGLSLFLVPKFLVAEDGSLGERNDIRCVGLEHKLGIKASPTCTLQYGDGRIVRGAPGAVAYLVGDEGRGLETMFIMMNAARYGVGIQGVGVAERACQHAVAYARERVQSRPVDGSVKGSATIVHHADVRRMIMTMRSQTQASRALACVAAAFHDEAHAHPDPAQRQQAMARYEFLVPLVKGYCTEMSLEVTSLGVQVHGGMGFIEETGAAQYYRDARILTIYEGTTAIQANDLLGRKTARDGGAVAREIAALIAATETELGDRASDDANVVQRALRAAREAFDEVVDYMVGEYRSDPNSAFGGAVPYLMLAGALVGGWQLARQMLVAQARVGIDGEDQGFMQAKIATARFYAEHVLPRASAWRSAILAGATSTMAIPEESL